MKTKYFYLQCQCGAFSHTARFFYNVDKDFPPELELEMTANDYDSFFSRLRKAFNFVFKREEFGSTVTTLINLEGKTVPEFITFLRKYIRTHDKWIDKHARNCYNCKYDTTVYTFGCSKKYKKYCKGKEYKSNAEMPEKIIK